MLLTPCSGHYMFPPLNWIGPSILFLLCVTMEVTTRYMFHNGHKQYTSNHKCQTTLHKILIAKVTISFTKLSQGIPRGGSVPSHPVQAFGLGIQPNWVLWDFLYNQSHSLLHPSATHIFLSWHYIAVNISFNTVTSNKYFTKT